ncbi:MAG TPA: ABC transporter permease [Xanthobacteraceae bacterium]|jgi:simple sugar transport system permease protein
MTARTVVAADRSRNLARSIGVIGLPVLCVGAALGACGILLLLLGVNPLFAYQTMIAGGLGSAEALSDTLAKTIPIALIGFGVIVTFRCKLWSLGGEGQFYAGAIGGALTGILIDAPPPILIPLEAIAGIAAGCFTAWIPAVLKARFHANEILVTLMLNYVPIFLALYLIQGPFSHGLAAKTVDIHPGGELPWLIVGGLRIHAGLIFVLIGVIATEVLINRTTFGYRVRAIGSNIHAAEAAGIDTVRTQFLAFILAGGFGGLAGMIQVAALHHNLIEGISPGYGFTAIVAALLGRLNPYGTLIASFGFAALVVGADSMQRVAKIENSTVFVIEGLILMFLLAGRIIGREQPQLS